MRDIFRHSLATVHNTRLLALLLIGDAVVLVGATFWLLIPEEQVWQLLASAISAIALLLLFLWLHAGTLSYGAEPQPDKLRAALRPSVRKLVWLLVGLAILFWCMRIVDGWTESQPQVSVYLYSKTPTWLRPTGGELGLYRVTGWAIAFVYWYLLPCLMLPWIAAKVTGDKFLAGLRALLRWQYWLAMAVTALVGTGVTQLLLGWVPGHTLEAQSASLVIRLAVAYLLAAVAWLATAGILGYFVGPQRTGEVVALPNWFRGRFFRRGSEAHGLLHQGLAMLRNPWLVGLQFAVGLLLLAASGIDIAQWKLKWQVVAEIVAGLLLLILFFWLQAATLAYGVDPKRENFRAAFRFRPARMAWLFLGLAILIAVAVGVDLLRAGKGLFVVDVLDVFTWFVVPCLLLPFAAAKIAGNSFRASVQALQSWRYWVGMAVLGWLAQRLSDLLSHRFIGTGTAHRLMLPTLGSAVSDLPLIVGWVAAAGLVGYFVGAAQAGTLENAARKAVV